MTERDLIQQWIDWKERTGRRPFPQKELAAAAGMSPTYLSSILTGARNAGTKTIERIATAIGVSISAFYSGPPDESPQADDAVTPALFAAPPASPSAASSAAPEPPSIFRPSSAPASIFSAPKKERAVPEESPPPQAAAPQKDMGLRFTAAGSDHINRMLGSYGFSVDDSPPPRIPPPPRNERRPDIEDTPVPSFRSEPSSAPERGTPPVRPVLAGGVESVPSIPLLASVPAGTWRDWIEVETDPPAERIPIVPVEPGRAFAVRAADESMAPKIDKGALLIVNPETRFSAFDGGIGIVAHGGRFAVRHIYSAGDSYILVPANPAFYPEVVPATDAQIFRIAFHIPE